MSWIFAGIIFGLLVWNVYLTDDRDYWRDLAESKGFDNERENDRLIEIVNRPKRRYRAACQIASKMPTIIPADREDAGC